MPYYRSGFLKICIQSLPHYDRSVSNGQKIFFLSPNYWVKNHHFLWCFASYSLQILEFQKIDNFLKCLPFFLFLRIELNYLTKKKSPIFKQLKKFFQNMLEYMKIYKKNAERVTLKLKMNEYFFCPFWKHFYHSVPWWKDYNQSYVG